MVAGPRNHLHWRRRATDSTFSMRIRSPRLFLQVLSIGNTLANRISAALSREVEAYARCIRHSLRNATSALILS
jgi:hypothetical protein